MQGSASNTARKRWHMVMASLLLQVTFCSLVTVSLLATPTRAGTRGRDEARVAPTTMSHGWTLHKAARNEFSVRPLEDAGTLAYFHPLNDSSLEEPV